MQVRTNAAHEKGDSQVH